MYNSDYEKYAKAIIWISFMFFIIFVGKLFFDNEIRFSAFDFDKGSSAGDFVAGFAGVAIALASALLLFSNLVLLREQNSVSKTANDEQKLLTKKEMYYSGFNSILSSLNDQIERNAFHINYLHATVLNSKSKIKSAPIHKKAITANSVYLAAFFDNEEVGAVIRSIHRVLKYLDHIEFEDTRMDCAKILRNQLSQKMLAILFYNSKSDHCCPKRFLTASLITANLTESV